MGVLTVGRHTQSGTQLLQSLAMIQTLALGPECLYGVAGGQQRTAPLPEEPLCSPPLYWVVQVGVQRGGAGAFLGRLYLTTSVCVVPSLLTDLTTTP